MCPGCGYRGDGVPYFQRASHVLLLTGAALLTYGVGGLVYWLVKRDDRICPSCGLGWGRSRAAGRVEAPLRDPHGPAVLPESTSGSGGEKGGRRRNDPARTHPVPATWEGQSGLPRGGTTRRVTGVLLALLSVLFLAFAFVQGVPEMAAISLFLGLSGAASFGWGWTARQRRREGILRRMQGRVLQLARVRGGMLTATDVASELDLSLEASERVLLSLDDGFRVRSEITRDGILLFEFPEIRWGSRMPPESDRRRAREWARELEASREDSAESAEREASSSGRGARG